MMVVSVERGPEIGLSYDVAIPNDDITVSEGRFRISYTTSCSKNCLFKFNREFWW